MKVYLVWYGTEQVATAFSTWEKASQYIDKEVRRIKKLSGYNVISDFSIEEKVVR